MNLEKVHQGSAEASQMLCGGWLDTGVCRGWLNAGLLFYSKAEEVEMDAYPLITYCRLT
jgi:hypothetical protein